MSNPTSNFGWQMPTPTDLVTDLPADFEVFGQAVDSDFADLLGGTTGQILSKTSATDLDFTWVSPNPGDITGVTAGTGISGGGTSGDVTITNSMATAIDAKGDLIVGTGADTFSRLAAGTNTYILTADSGEATGLKYQAPSVNTVIDAAGDLLYGTAADTLGRLAIGTAGQVLKVNSGATAPEWAAAGASSATTLIQRSTFSNVANTGTTFDAVFSSAYKSYLLVIESISASTGGDDLHLQYRYAGPTTQAASYNGNSLQFVYNSTTTTNLAQDNTNQITLNLRTGIAAEPGSGQFSIYNASGTSGKPLLNGSFTDPSNGEGSYTNATQSVARIYTGFLLKSSSTNITGTVAVYGLA